MKEFIVKENDAFRLRIKSWKCLNPDNLNSLEFIQENKNKEGDINDTSTYNFFLTDSEIKELSNGLQSITG
jgi:hypothetical protein